LGLSFLLVVVGWINYLGLRGSKEGQGPLPSLNLGLMVGLAVGAAAARMGLALEARRLRAGGGGTPRGEMAKRATLFFSLLSVIALVERGAALPEPGLGWTVLACLSGLWLPAAVAWSRSPQAGPLPPDRSLAARATFFGLAVGGLVSLGGPWLTGSPFAVGIWLGVVVTVGLLVAVAWTATVFRPGTAVLLVALSASLVGWAVLGSI
jgi:hypothetical protein